MSIASSIFFHARAPAQAESSLSAVVGLRSAGEEHLFEFVEQILVDLAARSTESMRPTSPPAVFARPILRGGEQAELGFASAGGGGGSATSTTGSGSGSGSGSIASASAASALGGELGFDLLVA
jgi:hypothetical protein